MKVGFTGTQQGVDANRLLRFKYFLSENAATEFHHGDCIGADEQAHTIARELGISIFIHPPFNQTKRAFCQGGTELPMKEYLARNRDIVDSTDMLIALPKTTIEQIRSGTWATIRYARNVNKRIIIL